ncbi:hypothetical protein ANCDUO_02270 [Ancylostoma duodenale]|uniref:ribonuclease H n=1 Tax=Ancylostoma duodenale TaxID=51022 RepID=A0A0C2HCY0_9BILA|nr:hypothetical protein ANCDUO_02270 [Ancylostoma duodenale]
MAKGGFYAVANGRNVGVYTTWDQCRAEVNGFPQASDLAIWKDAPVVYTDGACSGNGRKAAKAGYGVYWGSGHADNRFGPVHGPATNNRGELEAVDVALKQAIGKQMKCIIVRTDSQLLMKSMDSYMDTWKR